MMDRVNIRKEEYNRMETAIQEFHRENGRILKKMLILLQRLHKQNGGFYSDQTSLMIQELLEYADKEMIDSYLANASHMEAILRTMSEEIIQADRVIK